MSVAVVYHPLCLEHETGQHPERPARLEAIVHELENHPAAGWEMVSPQPATVQQIATVHSHGYIGHVAGVAAAGGGYLDLDTVLSAKSYDAALMGAGAAVTATRLVLEGNAESAFALPRPPGHHAGPDYGMGFCLFNNLAIAVRHAQSAFGLQRVLLVDFDVHHGNGTQDIFWDDPSVLYFSTHQFPWYPGSGRVEEMGGGPGRGFTINVPMPGETGDKGYQRVFREVLAPAARRFQPELIAVSAGYDGHWIDPLSGIRLSVEGFAALMQCLKGLADELCDGRLVACLEGGYDLRALGAAVLASVVVLSGGEPEDPLGPYSRNGDEPELDTLIYQVRLKHKLL